MPKNQPITQLVRSIAIILITLGIIVRFVNLNHKVYGHDEVYTTVRAAGYSRQEIDQRVFQNQGLQFGDLQQFQQIKPHSTYGDTVRSLAWEEPLQPPLYLWLNRAWMQAFDVPLKTLFHSSLTTQRSLPALLSLIGLPFMYGLAWELFASRGTAWIATALLALSPIQVLVAQTAQPDSLLTVMVIASSYYLLRGLRSQRTVSNSPPIVQTWLLYSLSLVIGLYTQPLFGLTIVAHGLYGWLVTGWQFRQRWRQWVGVGLMILGAIAAYLPWLWVMIMQQPAVAAPGWTAIAPSRDDLLQIWALSVTALLFDLDIGWTQPAIGLLCLPFLLLMAWALLQTLRTQPRPVWLFVWTGCLPWLLLGLASFQIGAPRSMVSRYLLACYPSLQLAVAYGLSSLIFSSPGSQPQRRWVGAGLAGLVTIAAFTSLTASAAAFTWWNKDSSYFNDQVAQRIRAIDQAMVVTDLGDDLTNTGNLISLSYRLPAQTPLLPLHSPLSAPVLPQQFTGHSPIVLHPSHPLRQHLEAIYGPLQLLYGEGDLWQLPP